MQIVLSSVLLTLIVPQCLVLSGILMYGTLKNECVNGRRGEWVKQMRSLKYLQEKMQFYIPVRPGSNTRYAFEFWWIVVRWFWDGRKGFLRPASYKAWKKKVTEAFTSFEWKCTTISSCLQTDTLQSWLPLWTLEPLQGGPYEVSEANF